MIRTARRAAALAVAATGLAVLAGVSVASAHIETDPPAIEAGKPATVGFDVEHGCGDADTTGLDIQLPTGITDASASKSGWQVTVDNGVVRFSGGTLDHHTADTFEVSFTAPSTPGVINFPTNQICGSTQQPWLDIAVDGQPEPEHPAPQVKVTEGPPTSDDLTPPTDDDSDETEGAGTTPAVSTTVAPANDDDGSNIGWWIGGIAVVVVIAAGAVIAIRSRRSPGPPSPSSPDGPSA
jgi:periplasmic copper chaperone A